MGFESPINEFLTEEKGYDWVKNGAEEVVAN